MTHKERFMASVNHKEGDRIPLCMDAEKEVWEMLKKALNVPSKEKVYDALDIDEWMLDPKVTDPRAKTLANGNRQSQWGYHVREVKTEFGSYGDIFNPPIKGDLTAEAIAAHDWPDPKLINFDH
jgi:hypothetical protein